MFGHITDLPRLFNFKDAVERYNNTKGIRGRTHIKPLKNTRRDPDTYKITAKRDQDGEIQAIQCWLYNTPVLVYKKDMLVINAYSSMTTNQFIDSIAPHWLRANMRNNCQVFYVRDEGEFLAGSGGTVVVPVDGDYRPVKGGVVAAKLNTVVLNRTRAAASRKGCKGVVRLAEVTSKLDGYWEALTASNEISPDEDTAWLKGLLKNGGYMVRERWNGEMMYYGFGQYGTTRAEGILPALKKYLYNAQYKHDDCYDKSPAPYGVIPKEWEKV
jgi:hypothetical protein